MKSMLTFVFEDLVTFVVTSITKWYPGFEDPFVSLTVIWFSLHVVEEVCQSGYCCSSSHPESQFWGEGGGFQN